MSCWYLHYTTIFSRSIPSINSSFPQGVRMKVGSFFQQKRALSCWKPQSSLRNRRSNSLVLSKKLFVRVLPLPLSLRWNILHTFCEIKTMCWDERSMYSCLLLDYNMFAFTLMSNYISQSTLLWHVCFRDAMHAY